MKKTLFFAAMFAALAVSCRSHGKPPEVDKWTSCAADGRRLEDMSIASVARSSEGVVKAFDRTACLLDTIPAGDQWQVWFHDNDSAEWVESTKAVFVIQRTDAGGPVRQIRAFKNMAGASAFAKSTPGRNEIAPDLGILRSVMSQ